MRRDTNIYVIGHKNPDTDSICSAISYAYLKNAMKVHAEHEYVPMRAGEVNEETQFVLKYFGVEEPELMKDGATQVKQIEIHEIPGIKNDLTVKKAWELMKEENVVTLPIIDDEQYLKGLITVSDIARSFMESHDNTVLGQAEASYRDIADTLAGEVIVGDENEYFSEGRVMIGTFHPDQMGNFIRESDLIITGNRTEDQLFAIDVHAKCLVLALDAGKTLSNTIKRLAEEFGTVVINSPHDTYTIARLINQAIPVKYLMTKNCMYFNSLDKLDDIKEVMRNSRHRDYPILNEERKYIGTISRRNLIGAGKKRMILVDHNEKSQAVDNIDETEIMEIIDHHRLGNLETIAPLLFRNQPVGCTATIIYQIYNERGLEIPKHIAGLLMSAIISDTLLFRSPTCTQLDITTAEALAKLAGVEDIKEYANEMFSAASNMGGKNAEDIFNQDFKEFIVDRVPFGVGQINAMSEKNLQKIKECLMTILEEERGRRGLEMVFFMLTNILEESTELIYVGGKAKEWVEAAFSVEAGESSAILPGVVSRKKQLIPGFITALHENE
ncbi:MAG: putative manganese-dependent inorganic diphosphatase [Lachnospiraceae bacterium]|nr:putative manganese-dependent inorganic diphosphatase [Lachnospiraceae bacterium]